MTRLSRTPLSRALTLSITLLLGLAITSTAVTLLRQASVQLWYEQSVAEAEQVSAELSYRVWREREPLMAALTLYTGSEEVTQNELTEATQLFQQSTQARHSPNIAFVTQNTLGEWTTQQSSSNLDLLPVSGQSINEAALLYTVNRALAQPNQVIIGPLFAQRQRSYGSMAVTTQNAGQAGILLMVVDFTVLMQEVTAALLTSNNTLRVLHPTSGDFNHSTTAPLPTQLDASHSVQIDMGEYVWELAWEFDADSGLIPDQRLSYAVGVAGLIITLLLTVTLYNLLQQQYRVQQKVEEKTVALRELFERLNDAQNTLMKQEKLASLGSLVAGIAHELNTPVGNALLAATTLNDRSDIIVKQLAESTLKRSDLEQFLVGNTDTAKIIEQNIRRAADLITSFKKVSVDQTSERRREFSLSTMVDEVLTTLHPKLKTSSHHVRVNIPDNLIMDSFPGPLGQVLTNLIINSLEHGFEGRTGGTIDIIATAPNPDQVLITYQDDGVGIPDPFHSKVFDPFFTTRLGKGGSGLGMHIVHNIVVGLLGGHITLLSPASGSGVCFEIQLPLKAPVVLETETAV